jgi:hypothetical protein
MFSARRLVGLLCVVAIILAAVAPSTAGLLWASLIPLLLFDAVVVIVQKSRENDDSDAPSFPFLSVVSSRAPPNA